MSVTLIVTAGDVIVAPVAVVPTTIRTVSPFTLASANLIYLLPGTTPA